MKKTVNTRSATYGRFLYLYALFLLSNHRQPVETASVEKLYTKYAITFLFSHSLMMLFSHLYFIIVPSSYRVIQLSCHSAIVLFRHSAIWSSCYSVIELLSHRFRKALGYKRLTVNFIKHVCVNLFSLSLNTLRLSSHFFYL